MSMRRSSLIRLLLPCMLALSCWLAASPSLSNTLADAAVDTLLSYRGMRETRANRGPVIDRMNRTAGVPLGSAWCESAQYSGYQWAAEAMGVRNPLMRTGSVAQQLRYANMIGSGLQVIPIAKLVGAGSIDIQRGDLLMARRGGGTARDIGRLWLGHAATALSRSGAYVRTIEGNTSLGTSGSQRDGDGMYVRTRKLTWFLAVVRVPAIRAKPRPVYLQGRRLQIA